MMICIGNKNIGNMPIMISMLMVGINSKKKKLSQFVLQISQLVQNVNKHYTQKIQKQQQQIFVGFTCLTTSKINKKKLSFQVPQSA